MITDKLYFNFHKHTYNSNVSTIDSTVSYEDYAERAKELGHKWLCSTEHSGALNWMDCYMMAQKHGLKYIHGAEYYFVPQIEAYVTKYIPNSPYMENGFTLGENEAEIITTKDSSNYHLMVVAKTRKAMQEMNYIMSLANMYGFYYKPRIDFNMLRQLPKGEYYVTTACVSGILKDFETKPEIFKTMVDIVGKDNFFVEIQYHDTDKQREHNRLCKALSKKYGVKLVVGCDSHMINENQKTDRDYMLHSKGIIYEEEYGWYLDYPSYDTIVERFVKQGVFEMREIYEALDNTLLLTETEDIIIDKKMKVPTMFPEKDRNWRLAYFKKLIFDKWKIYREKVPKIQWQKYIKEIKLEYDIVEKTTMEDYFISNYHIIKLGIELGGVLTRTGRGCFVGDTKVWTTDGYKNIKDVKIGDTIINRFGDFDTVIDTLKYDVEEPLIKIKSIGNKDIVLTDNHKVYVYDSINDEFVYKESRNIIPKTDFLTTPININKTNSNVVEKYDLSLYGHNHYDSSYVYEKYTGSNYMNKDIFSPTEMSVNGIVGETSNWKYRNNKLDKDSDLYKKIYKYTNMTPTEYCEYLKKYNGTRKIKRYIQNDSELMFFIGFILGDGHIKLNEKHNIISLYLQRSGKKDKVAKIRITKFLDKYNIPYTISNIKDKDMNIIYVKSNALKNMILENFKIYKDKEKNIDIEKIISENNIDNLKGLFDGLLYSDGHIDKDDSCTKERFGFDNTSMNLVSLFNVLCYIVEKSVTCRGYDFRSKHTSIKTRTCRRSFFEKDGYICSKIFNVENTDIFRGYVYDLTIKNDPSFLVENSIVHNSAASFLINLLLGFTTIDRLKSKLPLLPHRFMSISRIIENNSSPDID